MNYYNDNDKAACAWLRELIASGLIPAGDVDDRPIQEIQPNDLRKYTQVHLFAGIGGWAHALRLGGWPDDRPVWTGSCPCQPFSSAGKQLAERDPRHLWPEMRRLVAECRPTVVFGEQVAAKAGRIWLAGVRAEMEALGYAVGAADLCAAGIGSPHIRQRLWWVAYAGRAERRPGPTEGRSDGCGQRDPSRRPEGSDEIAARGGHRKMAYGIQPGLEGLSGDGDGGHEPGRIDADQVGPASESGDVGGVADANQERRAGNQGSEPGVHQWADFALTEGMPALDDRERPRPHHCAWEDADWLFCRDGRWRRVEPGTFPLADGLPGRVGLLRGYGNAIVPQVAAEFVMAAEEAIREP